MSIPNVIIALASHHRRSLIDKRQEVGIGDDRDIHDARAEQLRTTLPWLVLALREPVGAGWTVEHGGP
jgi:hypothetical protein